MRSAIEMIGISCSIAICCRTVMPAIEPSLGSMTVERMDTGRRPANVTRSTDASVCPARFSTPPFRYLRGNIWPGLLRSLGLESGEARVSMVFALSAAETPVDMPTLASWRDWKYLFKFCTSENLQGNEMIYLYHCHRGSSSRDIFDFCNWGHHRNHQSC